MDAFWSLTMYDVPDFYLVANPIDCYSIGDRTPGLHTGGDGSVTVYLHADSPGPGKEANWLPDAGRGVPTDHAHVLAPSSQSWTGPMSCPLSARSDRAT